MDRIKGFVGHGTPEEQKMLCNNGMERSKAVILPPINDTDVSCSVSFFGVLTKIVYGKA